MRWYKLTLFIFLFVFFLTACLHQQKDENYRIFKIETLGEIELNDNSYNVIDKYINKHPKFENLVLICFPYGYFENFYDDYNIDQYLLGPAYEGIIYESKFPIQFFKFKGKKIFIYSGLENLFATSSYRDSVFQSSQIKTYFNNVTDRSGDKVCRNGYSSYLHNAVLFSLKKNGNISICYRPDTLFLPKSLSSTVKFDSGVR